MVLSNLIRDINRQRAHSLSSEDPIQPKQLPHHPTITQVDHPYSNKVFQIPKTVLTLHCIGIDFTDVLACACRVGNTNALLCIGSIVVIVVIDHDLSSSEEVSNILHLFLKTCRERARTISSTTNSFAIMRRCWHGYAVNKIHPLLFLHIIAYLGLIRE